MIKRAWDFVEDGLFGYRSAATLGLFRIVFGFLLIVNWTMLATQFEDWFSEKGMVPLAATKLYQGLDPIHWDPISWVGNDGFTMFCMGLLILSSVFLMVGKWTRLASILVAALTVAFHHRNPIILHSGDTLNRNFCLILAMAPAGRMFSLDALAAAKKGKPLEKMVSIWPQRLLEFTLATMYFTTVWHKWLGVTWRDGTATWYSSQLTEFTKFPVPEFMHSRAMLAVTTYGTLLIELALASLVFYRPLRVYAVIGGIALHLGIEYSMNIPLFAFLCITGYITYFEGDQTERFIERIKRKWAPRAEKIELPV